MSGEKFDEGKPLLGLAVWTPGLIRAAADSCQIPAVSGSQMEVAYRVSQGKFLSAWSYLLETKSTSLTRVIDVLVLGAKRYGAFNWKGFPPEERVRCYHAAMRHALQWGEPDEGFTHEDHLGCNLMFLLHWNWKPVEA
jgi:hypothetical protein